MSLTSMPRPASSPRAASMSETVSPPSAEPGAAVVRPRPNVTEAPEPGGVNLDVAKAGQRGGVVVEPPAQPLVELLGPVDVGHRDDLDLELHVDLPDGRVAARVRYLGGAHACLLRCVGPVYR